ncbi:MAG: Tetratricopeptide repeat protein [Chthoniobacteraceae bacterium]|nr:Tetratricopeptide repeat protein [Chthoniobacteraceae bacterium]
MKLFPLFLLAATTGALADIRQAQDLLKRNESVKAEAHLRQLLIEKPADPWLLYNCAVALYAAKDFVKADELWQQLAAAPMPDDLREHVWAQVGNVSYRIAEPSIEREPDAALSRLEQSREAFRVALSFNKRNESAKKNLPVVEKQLERVYSQLAKRLAEEAKKEASNEKAIEKLQAALTYQQQAQTLNANAPEHKEARADIEKQLNDRFSKKAVAEEKRGDQGDQNSQWAREEAKKEFEKAAADFQEAQQFDPHDQAAVAGENRVKEKLANLLDKLGRKQQADAVAEARWEPQRAEEKFQQALDNFQEALAQKADHHDAQQGEKEVRQQLEQLHLEQGDRLAKQGEQQAKNDPANAAENLLSALEHFEQAKALVPEDNSVQPRIDQVQQELPDLLTKLGQQEQSKAAAAEPKSPQEAVAHLEKAEASFGKAAQIAKGNEEAKQGQKEVQESLARLRQQLAQRSEPKQSPSKEPNEGFESMLAKFKEQQRPPERMDARHHAGEKYDPSVNKNFKNW